MHDRVRRFVEHHVEVLPLLVGACDFPAGDMFLEGVGGGADFAVDDVVGEGLACFDRAADEVLADVVDYAGYFADLERY